MAIATAAATAAAASSSSSAAASAEPVDSAGRPTFRRQMRGAVDQHFRHQNLLPVKVVEGKEGR